MTKNERVDAGVSQTELYAVTRQITLWPLRALVTGSVSSVALCLSLLFTNHA